MPKHTKQSPSKAMPDMAALVAQAVAAALAQAKAAPAQAAPAKKAAPLTIYVTAFNPGGKSHDEKHKSGSVVLADLPASAQTAMRGFVAALREATEFPTETLRIRIPSAIA